MTLAREDSLVVFHCDECPEFLETEEPELEDALTALRKEGWKAVRAGSQWEHLCPACGEDHRRNTVARRHFNGG